MVIQSPVWCRLQKSDLAITSNRQVGPVPSADPLYRWYVLIYELNFIAINKLNMQQSVSKLERLTQESFTLAH